MRRFVVWLVFLFLAACTMSPRDLALAPDSTLIIVRHADRENENLSPKGRERAAALVPAMAEFDLAAIHAPGIQRNLDTAAPLAEAGGLRVKRLPQENPTPRLIASADGRAVIWIGNTGNIRKIWSDLRLEEPAPLNYGDLFILRTDGAGMIAVERRFFGPD